MIDREMDELALLWSDAAGLPEEEQMARTLAARVSWRARVLRYADLVAAIGIAAGIALLVLMGDGGAIGISALFIVTALGWSTWKRQALWEIETSLAASGGASMLETAAAGTNARLKRTEVSILAVPVTFALALWFGAGLHQPGMDSLQELSAYAEANPERTVVTLAVVASLIAWLLRSRRLLRRELQRIEGLRREYEEEAAYSAP